MIYILKMFLIQYYFYLKIKQNRFEITIYIDKSTHSPDIIIVLTHLSNVL